MEPVLRALGCYLLLLIVVRLSGKRGLAQITIFDLILLLLISQTVGQALIGDDSSLTTAAMITVTLVDVNRVNDAAAHRFADMSHVLEDAPLVLIQNGHFHEDRPARMKIRREDPRAGMKIRIAGATRTAGFGAGLEWLATAKHAVPERSGAISLIPAYG